jgi:threonine dehydratase
VARVGELAFAATRAKVDLVVAVSEEEIATAMLRLFETGRIAAEGAGATALAAVLSGRLDREISGGPVVIPVSGSNVDAFTFVAALQAGLAARARSWHGEGSDVAMQTVCSGA